MSCTIFLVCLIIFIWFCFLHLLLVYVIFIFPFFFLFDTHTHTRISSIYWCSFGHLKTILKDSLIYSCLELPLIIHVCISLSTHHKWPKGLFITLVLKHFSIYWNIRASINFFFFRPCVSILTFFQAWFALPIRTDISISHWYDTYRTIPTYNIVGCTDKTVCTTHTDPLSNRYMWQTLLLGTVFM